MAGDSISIYAGEFLVSPVPLELSFNYCSHKCGYCFANLNKPDRTADVGATMRLLSDYQNRNTLEARLLQAGYPVLISNRVDPFATSNYAQAVPVMRAMAQMGIPVAIQTRGAASKPALESMRETIEFLPPSVWYVSIAMLDEGLKSRIEPGAPSIESRFELMRELKAAGHRVVLGHNPCVRQWQEDARPLLQAAKDAGAEGVWLEMLHFNPKQIAQMSDRERGAIGQEILSEASQKHQPLAWQHVESTRLVAQEIGLETFSINQKDRSDFWQPFFDCYPQRFPVMQEMVNACHDDGFEPDELIDFDAFASFFEPLLPKGELSLGTYIGATAHQIFRTHNVPNRMSYRQLLSIVFSDHRMKSNPARMDCFAYAGKRDGKKWQQWVDDANRPYLTFSPSGFDDYFSEVEPQEVI